MAYTKTTWTDGSTPLSADNMNHIEIGIKDNEDAILSLTSDVYTKDEVDALIGVNSFDTPVDLLSGKWSEITGMQVHYTYVAPADGYIVCDLDDQATDSSYIILSVNTGHSTGTSVALQLKPAKGNVLSLFVRKGMSIAVDALVPRSTYQSDVAAMFYPLQ